METEAMIERIHALPRLVKTGDLGRIKRLLASLGNPQEGRDFIHVTGTNGKGSTATMIAHILEESGLTVGLFTSPFIMRFNERFRINHKGISDAKLVEYGARVFSALEKLQEKSPDFEVTEFEFVTALAFTFFAKEDVDVSVIEVGIGGDTDSTNVLTPVLSVITSVGLDHAALLGDTLESVARHKAGIIKHGKPVVVAELAPEAEKVVEERVAKTGSKLYRLGVDFFYTARSRRGWNQAFDYRDTEDRQKDLAIPLLGEYQLSNAALAVRAAKLFAKKKRLQLLPAEIKAGLAESSWPGRFEKISDEPLIVLDGAHNVSGVEALVSSLQAQFHRAPMTLLLGMLGDKAVSSMLACFSKLNARLFLVPVPDNPRALSPSDYPMPENADVSLFGSWQEAVATHLSEHADEPLIVAGSLYLVSAVRQTLMEENDD